MPTYYEILKVPHMATVAEVETAYESQYNHWRRLVTHHDPEMVNKANQALRWLEKAHVTLTDPTKREAYDASIGLSGPVGGLSDPRARPKTARPTPPPPRQRVEPPMPPAAAERADAWVCPKCQTVNAVKSMYCKKCGHTLGQICPDCSKVVETTAQFCSSCGANIPKSLHRKEIQQELVSVQYELTKVEQFDPRQDETIKELKKATVTAGAWMSFGLTWAFRLALYWVVYDLLPGTVSWTSVMILSFAAVGVQLLFTLVLAIMRRAFGLSAFLAVASGLAVCGLVGTFTFTGLATVAYTLAMLGLTMPRLRMATSVLATVAYTLAMLGLSFALGRYSRWVWVLVILVTLLAGGQWLVVLYFYRLPLMLSSHLLITFLFGLLGVWAWWTTHGIEHRVAVALGNKRRRTEHLQRQIKMLSRELAAL